MTAAFSVVTVVRNDLVGLKATWESLSSQQCEDWEWVVVDGASTDGTSDWLKTIDDSRVHWSSEPDGGIYEAMNKGARGASGQLLLFLNAADRLASPTSLQTVLDDWQSRGWRWGYGITRILDEDDQLVMVHSLVPYKPSVVELGYRSIPHQSCYFTREFFDELGGFDLRYRVAADQELCMRAGRESPPRVMGDVLADFRTGGASWGRAPDAFVREAAQIRKDQGKPFGGNRVTDTLVTWSMAGELRLRALAGRRLRRAGRP